MIQVLLQISRKTEMKAFLRANAGVPSIQCLTCVRKGWSLRVERLDELGKSRFVVFDDLLGLLRLRHVAAQNAPGKTETVPGWELAHDFIWRTLLGDLLLCRL